MYKLIIRILFIFPPEKAHKITFTILNIVFRIPFLKRIIKNYLNINNKKLERELFGIKFKNPIGLAGGLDKDADCVEELSHLGFGFIEIGTVTPKTQEGNSKPRLFRLKKHQALINRMGFNNKGVDYMVENLKKIKSDVILAGNIGKNKNTLNENAVDDYKICFEKLYDYVDFFVINISSPNTPNLRELQDKEPLKNLLHSLQNINSKKIKRKPILIKIAPDLNESQLDDIIEVVNDTKIDGVIATNTTISRDGLKEQKEYLDMIGGGGLSGPPLKDRSTKVIEYIFNNNNNSFPIIGVGGINSPEDAIEKLKAGASLIQIYTGFIYNGPKLIKNINKKIIEECS